MSEELMVTENSEMTETKQLSFAERLEIAKAATSFESIWEFVKRGDTLKIDAKRILVVPMQTVDNDTGEVLTRHRCVFVATDGRCYGTTSQAVQTVVETLFTALQTSDFEESVPCVFTMATSRGGNDFVQLTIA